jgi:hypothetical protein
MSVLGVKVDPSDPDFLEIRAMAMAGLTLHEIQALWTLKHRNKTLDLSQDEAHTYPRDQSNVGRKRRK